MTLIVCLDKIIYRSTGLNCLIGLKHDITDFRLYILHVWWRFNAEKGKLLLHTFTEMAASDCVVIISGINTLLQLCITICRADTVQVRITVTCNINIFHTVKCKRKEGK